MMYLPEFRRTRRIVAFSEALRIDANIQRFGLNIPGRRLRLPAITFKIRQGLTPISVRSPSILYDLSERKAA